MTDPWQMTAAGHLSHAERLLLEAAEPSPEAAHKLGLAGAHLDCARTIIVMQEAERNRQSRLDAKSQMAGLSDILTRAMPTHDDEL